MNHADVLIVGAGIVGLAHALAAARRGLKVIVFERHPWAIGASIRNFGMIWPIGQPLGTLHDRALKTREIWQQVASAAGIALDPCGSLLLVYRVDELEVLHEFIETTKPGNYTIQLLTPSEVATKSSAAATDGLLAGLWSTTEMTVDPREAIGKLPDYLSQIYGVTFKFGTVVTEISYPVAIAGGEKWTADRILVCSGSDFETLYPALYTTSGITKTKLQMMRTRSQADWKLGPSLYAGLTLTHYAAFAHCPSLPALKQRIATETPHLSQWGIHVMVSQNAFGELIIGDSHEYGLNPEPFDRADVNQYILDYLKTFTIAPSFEIAETWHGVYAKLPGKTELIVQPEAGVTIINALGGAGMTLSFGLAEEVMANL
jgi:FAD dependent oxidoreductase TIGR03364